MTDYNELSPGTLSILLRWILYGIHPGHAFECFLANDLSGWIDHADENTFRETKAIRLLLCNQAPMTCYGDRERLSKWTGLEGSDRDLVLNRIMDAVNRSRDKGILTLIGRQSLALLDWDDAHGLVRVKNEESHSS